MPLYYYGDKLSENILETPNGALICKDVPIGRTGELQYLAKDLGLMGRDPLEVITVYREAEDIFDEAAIASFEGMPVTDGHPPENVTADNWSIYSKGHIQNVRRGKAEDGQDHLMLADLFIFDPILKEKINTKQKRQVSSGYSCSYKAQIDGAIHQVGQRGNHVAVVENGRAGPSVSIMDSMTVNESVKQPDERRTKYMSLKNEGAMKTLLNLFSAGTKSVQTADEQDALIQDASTIMEALKSNDSAVPVVEVKAEDVNSTQAVDTNTVILETLARIVTTLDAMSKEQKEGKEEQKEAGKELAEGDKKVKEAKDTEEVEVTADADTAVIEAAVDKASKLDDLMNQLVGDESALAEVEEVEADDCDVPTSYDAADALFIPANVTDTTPVMDAKQIAKDTAIAIIRDARPSIAAIKDAKERARITDALANSINKYLETADTSDVNVGAGILAATSSAVQALSMDSANPESFDVSSRQEAYNKRNAQYSDNN